MVEISVIMPAYNEEDHLDESLNSIINQSFNDLEIICVNDGSGGLPPMGSHRVGHD